MTALLELDGVTRAYGGLRAVDGVDLRWTPEPATG